MSSRKLASLSTTLIAIVLSCAATALGQATAAPTPAGSGNTPALRGGASVAPAAPAPANTPAVEQEARGLFELGRDAYQNARYDRALEYFKQSYALSGRAALLNNIGAAADRLRRDQEALDAYQRYLDQVPDAENRVAIENRIAALRAGLAAAEPTPALAPTPQETALAAPPPQKQAAITEKADDRDRGEDDGGSVLTKWWLWAGVGAVAVAGVVLGVVVASGGDKTVDAMPPVVDSRTRVIEL